MFEISNVVTTETEFLLEDTIQGIVAYFRDCSTKALLEEHRERSLEHVRVTMNFSGNTARHELSAESSFRGSKPRAIKQRILTDEFFSEIPFPRPLSLHVAFPRDP